METLYICCRKTKTCNMETREFNFLDYLAQGNLEQYDEFMFEGDFYQYIGSFFSGGCAYVVAVEDLEYRVLVVYPYHKIVV